MDTLLATKIHLLKYRASKQLFSNPKLAHVTEFQAFYFGK